MKLCRALMSLEISLSGKLLVAAIDPAWPYGGLRGFLWGGFVLLLGLLLMGVLLLVGLSWGHEGRDVTIRFRSE